MSEAMFKAEINGRLKGVTPSEIDALAKKFLGPVFVSFRSGRGMGLAISGMREGRGGMEVRVQGRWLAFDDSTDRIYTR